MFDIHADGAGRVRVSGRFDAAGTERAKPVLRACTGPTTLDCAGLDYISSAGIAAIMEAYKRLADEGHALVLENLAPRVKSVFVYTGLDRVLGIR